MKFNAKYLILNSNRGQAMLLTVLILGSAILSASAIAGYMMVLKIRSSSDIANSSKSIYAADSGIEWELYKHSKDPNQRAPEMSNGSSFEYSENDGIIRVVGSAGGTFRAFELELSAATSTP